NICKKHLLTLLVPIGILTLGLSACHDAYDQPESASSAEQALLSKLQHYYDDLPGQSRSGNSISIKEIEQRHYVIVDDTVVETPQTRTLDPNSFDITRVSLNIDGKEGFAIISEDERLDHVYYFTDNGCISDTAQIEGLKWLIDEMPNFAAAELVSNEPITRATLPDISIAPIVRFKWGQGYPFNILTPYCSCSSCDNDVFKKHNPVGGLTVAVAQTIATLGKFDGTYFGSRNINFATLPSKSEDFSSMLGQEIAHFFHEVAVGCQIWFGCVNDFENANNSGGHLQAARNYLRDMQYDCFSVEADINIEILLNELKRGIPHIISGSRYIVRPTWIIDGIKIKDGVCTYSCNWGNYGKSNGWIYGNPYTKIYKNPDTGQTSLLSYDMHIENLYINSK
ncbi:MAG: C10 family peptidase, partial [Muribaculaceae bacterium]|nr:C10 family peptidase [Muribaculaceae bacterium]